MAKTKEETLQEYAFPELGVTVEAKDIEEAYEKAKLKASEKTAE